MVRSRPFLLAPDRRRLTILIALTLVAPAGAQAERPGIESFVEAWSDRDWSERERASREILEHWETWSAGDLARLESAALEARGAEVRERAGRALERLRVRRRLGADLVARGADRILIEGDEDACVRLLASLAETWLSDRIETSGLEAVVDLAGSREWSRRAADVLRAAGKDAIRPYAPLAVAWLGHPVLEVRLAAAEALCRLGERRWAPSIARLLGSADPTEREAAARALGALEAPSAGETPDSLPRARTRTTAPDLARRLDDPDPRVVAAAMESLGRMRPREVAGAVRRFADPPFGDADPVELRARIDLYFQACRWLDEVDPRGEVERAAGLLSDPAPDVRRRAALTIGQARLRWPADLVAPLLDDPDDSVRAEAIRAAGRLGDTGRADRIAERLSDPVADVREEAVGALVALRARHHAPALARLLDEPESRLTALTLRALVALRARQIAPRIADRLRASPGPQEPGAWIDALGELGGPEHAPLLRGFLAHESETVRVAAVAALLAIRSYEDLPAIVEASADRSVFWSLHTSRRELAAVPPVELARILPLVEHPCVWVRLQISWLIRESYAREHAAVVVRLLSDPEPTVRASAARTLAVLGARDRAAEVERSLDDPVWHVRRAAREALDQLVGRTDPIGEPEPPPPSIDELRAALDESDRPGRAAALAALASSGSSEAIESIRPLLDSNDPACRAAAATALGELGDRASASRILGRLADPEVRVREAVVRALGRLEAADLAPAIEILLADADPDVRIAATAALAAVEARASAGAIAALLDDPDETVAMQAIRSLAALGSREHAPSIARFFSHRDGEFRLEAVRAALALEARDLAPALAGLIDDPEYAVQSLAIEALGALGGPPEAARIARFLEAPPAYTWNVLLRTIGRIGSRDHAGVVAGYLDHPDRDTRASALEALARLDGAAAQVAAERLLVDRAPAVRAAASRVLEATARLEPLLADPDPEVRRTVARRLGQEGSGTSPEVLARALDDAAPEVRIEAVLGAWRLAGPDARVASERLRPLESDPSRKVRTVAAIAREALGAPDPPSADEAERRVAPIADRDLRRRIRRMLSARFREE